jgi:predicted O-methyltransferase YrrM
MISLERLFPNFVEKAVSFYEAPLGPWSTPLIDVAMLIKIAQCAESKTVLELGSYRGYTALALARNLGCEARIVTVDSDPRHGEAYFNTQFSHQIERRVSSIDTSTFARDAYGSYDLIFVDADHSYTGVKRDTETVFNLLSDHGFILWHDYANWGRFSGKNGVPEYLHGLSEALPIARIAGTWLAIYSPAWRSGSGADAYRRSLVENDDLPFADPWASELNRG